LFIPRKVNTHRYSRPKLNIVTGGARTDKQTLLSFPTVSSEHDRRPHHSHHNEVHRRAEPTILTEHEVKAPRKQKRKKNANKLMESSIASTDLARISREGA
jgi:hypothetical protein